MKVLLFSSLYPSAVRPIHGIFVETRLRELLKTGQVEAKVVAPVPWFPLKAKRFGEYAQFAATPRQEQRNGLEVHHPRYLLLPKVGMNMAPHAMALGALPTLKRLQREGFDFDLDLTPPPAPAATAALAQPASDWRPGLPAIPGTATGPAPRTAT